MAHTVRLSEAAEQLGIDRPQPTLWLRRYLRRRERAAGVALLRNVGRGRRPTYHVAMAEVRQHAPELFASVGRSLEVERDRRGDRDEIRKLRQQVEELRGDLAILTEAVRVRLPVARRR